jgi:hypothetical protein
MKWLKANKSLFVLGAVLWMVLVVINPVTNPKTWGNQMTTRGIICWTSGPGEGDFSFHCFGPLLIMRSEELETAFGRQQALAMLTKPANPSSDSKTPVEIFCEAGFRKVNMGDSFTLGHTYPLDCE